MTLTVDQLRSLSDREAAAADQLATNAQRATWLAWATFSAWYAGDRVRELAKQTTTVTEPARAAVGNLGIAYMREVIAGLHGGRVQSVKLHLPDARLGADLLDVYSRPAEAYRSTYAVTEDVDAAVAAAKLRLDTLVADDLLVARRDGEHQQMAAVGITHYRRIVHPERSKTGVCGLCLAASDRVYTIEELLPIHDDCKCTVAPDSDTADEAVKVDLEAIYKAAGGTTDGRALKKVRFQVNQHGELGPVLTRHGDRFQAKGQAPKGDPIARAKKELDALEPVLTSLQRRSGAGEDVTGPLAYQLARVTKLRRIASAA